MRDVVRELLETGLNVYEKKLQARLIDDLVPRCRAALQGTATVGAAPPCPGEETNPHMARLWAVCAFLEAEIAQETRRLAELRLRDAEFHKRCSFAATVEEKRRHILDYARDLGASGRKLREDRRAQARWFGEDAVSERYVRRHTAAERRIALCLRQLGTLAAQLLAAVPASELPQVWPRLRLEATVRPLLNHEGDKRVALAAFRCLATALAAATGDALERLVDDATLTFLYRAALDDRQHVWLQCEALSLLQHLSLPSLRQALEMRLTQPRAGDDLFVRRRAVQILGAQWARLPEFAELLPQLSRDPSPFVRQGLARGLTTAPAAVAGDWLGRLAQTDEAPAVRAAAVWEARALLTRPDAAHDFLTLVVKVLAQETDEFVLRTALHAVAVSATRLALAPENQDSNAHAAAAVTLQAPAWRRIVELLAELHERAASLAVRRWAAQTLERIACLSEPQARVLLLRLQAELPRLACGQSRRLPSEWFADCDEALVGRVLAVLTQDDFGCDVQWNWRGVWLRRGPVLRFRLWRLLHELRHPDPAKRQAFAHTSGRTSDACLRAPSAILAELAETKVPGEPLFLPSEAGWRPYLPLVDDVLSALALGWFARPVRFWTSEGMTELIPPRTPWRRLWARIQLNWSFTRYARLRNWREDDPVNPAAYVTALERLGFRIRFQAHAFLAYAAPPLMRSADGPAPESDGPGRPDSVRGADPAVLRFFPSLALPAVIQWWYAIRDFFVDFATYFTSAFENTLPHLIVFTTLAIAYFLGRHWYLNWTLRRARQRLPLVIGGWGTRGKSGTERLKAALFNALGYSIVSKTTGCEAMFLYAPAYGTTREMFLYRPYDKATIWEQRQVVCAAAELGAETFLWECMGLNPSYVRILQHQWMRDDLATITNTYPDHEDIQGPAGFNIAQVMTQFIPRRAKLLTSEEQMRPILAEAAAGLGTDMVAVNWLEAGLLAPDVLRRFPYDEHPFNIALVLALADELGIDRDFALKEMADRVVPDLGVLKTSPVAPMRTRRLQFTNGMSANERHGCLSNWTRAGFDRRDPDAEPDVWLSTVVNNRADRIPRSRVFAEVLVQDLAADRHFLIGGNLTGLQKYLREAWEAFAANVTLWPAADPERPLHVLESWARRFRQPRSEAAIRARLRVTTAAVLGAPSAGAAVSLTDLADTPEGLRTQLAAAGCDPALTEAAVKHLERDCQALAEYQALAERVRQATPRQHDEINAALRGLLWQWFERKLVVIADYHATGDQIVERICAETPPGFLNRIMGVQNIKGTGLDFVYRWEAWHACHRACTRARNPEQALAEQGVRELAAFQDYGLLCEEYVRETVAAVQQMPVARLEEVQAHLRGILVRMDAKMSDVRQRLKQGAASGGWLAGLAAIVEALVEALSAVRRRKHANQIYRDLVNERISHGRAALELQALTKMQKGGWVEKKLRNWLSSVRSIER